jgi:hypothetical protein
MKAGDIFLIVVAANLVTYLLLGLFFLFIEALAIIFLADVLLLLLILLELSKNGNH